jgi:phage head maturation protease
MFTRAAPIVSSADEASRSVEICFASEQPVKRYSWEEGRYVEVLQVTRAAIDTVRLDAGMSFLDSHRAASMDSRLGSVIPGSFRLADGKAYCRVKFSRNDRASEIFTDILDGHVVPVSVGYRIEESRKEDGKGGGLPIITATRWTPLEISAVPIPADANAGTRANEDHMPQTEQINNQRQDQQRPARADTVRERTRISDIRHLARSAQMDESEIDDAIDGGTSVEDFRNRAFDKMIERQNQSPTFPHRAMDEEYGLSRRAAMADALMTRVNPAHKPADASREFCGLSLIEIAREVIQAGGTNTRGMSRGEVAERALHTTSDFPLILGQMGQAVLQQAYEGEPSGIKSVARAATIDDFRPKRSIRVSDWPDLKKVNEHGEFTRGTIYESEESYQLSTYGRVIGFTRQLLINDSLGALTEPAKRFGKAAATLESKILAGILVANPQMSDGKSLFHANHQNILAAAPLDVASLGVARTTMRKQVDEKGEPAGLRAKYLVVPPELEIVAERLLTQVAATKTGDVNPLAGSLELVVDDRLVDPKVWYVAADPNSVEGLEYAYLTGEPGPQFSERIGFDVDGVEYRCRIDFGAGFLGWRGWYRNPGQ